MTDVLGAILAAALVAHVGAHVSIAVGLARAGAYVRAAAALVVPPLAPWWGWERGMRQRVFVWLGALAIYALAVAVA